MKQARFGNLKVEKDDLEEFRYRAERELKPKFNLPQKKYVKPNTNW